MKLTNVSGRIESRPHKLPVWSGFGSKKQATTMYNWDTMSINRLHQTCLWSFCLRGKSATAPGLQGSVGKNSALAAHTCYSFDHTRFWNFSAHSLSGFLDKQRIPREPLVRGGIPAPRSMHKEIEQCIFFAFPLPPWHSTKATLVSEEFPKKTEFHELDDGLFVRVCSPLCLPLGIWVSRRFQAVPEAKAGAEQSSATNVFA